VIAQAFAARRAQGRPALIPYVTAGHPLAGSTVAVLDTIAGAGADVIELGIPFSDPLADGPTIQRSSFRSLRNGTTVRRVLEDLATFREDSDIPIVLFTYLNPVMRYGLARFLEDAVAAGAQGLLVTDLPTGADPELERAVIDCPLDLIRLVAPTTPIERVGKVAQGGSGFLYYISRTGVTGARREVREALAREVELVRSSVELPVAVGFGISTPRQAAQVGSVADGVVVGSALVQTLESEGLESARTFVEALRAAL
jgi:tryptophan synthase alpha chain